MHFLFLNSRLLRYHQNTHVWVPSLRHEIHFLFSRGIMSFRSQRVRFHARPLDSRFNSSVAFLFVQSISSRRLTLALLHTLLHYSSSAVGGGKTQRKIEAPGNAHLMESWGVYHKFVICLFPLKV